jgi:hypothetical protein
MINLLKNLLASPEEKPSSNGGKSKRDRSNSKEQSEELQNVSENSSGTRTSTRLSSNKSSGNEAPSSSQSSTQNSPPVSKPSKTKSQSIMGNDENINHNIKAMHDTAEEGTVFCFFLVNYLPALCIEPEDQKLNILLGHRINTIRTYLRERGIHYSSKDDKKTLAKLLLGNDPDLDGIPDTVSVSSVELGSTASMRTPVKTTKRPSISRYDLRSGSKKTRRSSASSSSSSHHFSPGGFDPEEFILPEVKSFHPKRKSHHKKSPKQVIPPVSPKKASSVKSAESRSRKNSTDSSSVVGTRRSKRLSSGTETSETSGDFIVEDAEETTDQEQTDENLTADERIPTEESRSDEVHTEGFTQPLERISENPTEYEDAQFQPEEHRELIPLPQPDPVIEHEIQAIAETHEPQEQHHESMEIEQANSPEKLDASAGQDELPSSSDEMEFGEEENDNTSIPSQDPGTGNDFFQFQPALQQQSSVWPQSGFRGSGGRGKAAEPHEASSTGEGEEEDDSSDSENEYYETNTINSEDQSQQLEQHQIKSSFNADGEEVFDLLDDSDTEMTNDNREEESISEEVKEEHQHLPAGTGVVPQPHQHQSSESSAAKAEEVDVVSKNPVIQEAMEAFSKLGSKFIIAITDDQQQSSGSSLPALSDKEYDLLKTFLERMKPATNIEAEQQQQASKAKDTEEITLEKETTPQKEISIQTEPLATSIAHTGPDDEMDVLANNSNQRRGVQWNVEENTASSSKTSSSITDSSPFLTTPQLYRFEGRNTRKVTPYNFRVPLSTPGSEDASSTIGSSSKKRVLSDYLDGDEEGEAEEDRQYGFDHARKRISFGAMEPPSQPSSTPSSSLVPVPAASTSFQSNLKFNLINNNFLSSNAYIPKFRGNAISFAKNNEMISQKPDFLNGGRNCSIVGSGLSFLEKRKLEKKEQGKGTTSSSSGVVAKEILKALSDITSPIEEFRKQPIPRIYPNDLFGTFPKPNLFTNLPAASQQQQQQSQQTKAIEAPLTTSKQEKSVSFNLSSSSSKKSEREEEQQPEMLMSVTKQTPQQSQQNFASPPPSFTFSQPALIQTPAVSDQKKSINLSSPVQQQQQSSSEFTFGEPVVIADDSSVSSLHRVSDASIKYIFSPPAKGGRKRKGDSVGGSKSVEKSFVSTPSSSSFLPSSAKRETEKPSSASAVPSIWSSAAMSKGVKCPVCRVTNDEKATKCVSCESLLKTASVVEDVNSSASSHAKAATPANDIWAKFSSGDQIKCPVCMVRNNKGSVKCVSCETPLASENKTNETTSSAPVSSSSTGGFKFGAPSSSSGSLPISNFTFKAPEAAATTATSFLPASTPAPFQFGAAPSSLSVKMPPVETGFMFKPSANTNNSEDPKSTSSAATASFSFDKTSYSSNNGGNQPAISPSLPFTPLHANSTTTPAGFAFKSKNPPETSSKKQERDDEEDEDDEAEDRSKRSKRKASDEGDKIKFAFGSGSATSQQAVAFPPLPVTGGFTFGAGKTTTSTLPSIPEKKRGRDQDEEEGSPPKKEEKKPTKQEESIKPSFTFGDASATAHSAVPATSGFAFGSSQQQPEKSTSFPMNSKDSKKDDFPSSSFSSVPLDQKPTGGLSFSFSAGASSTASDAKNTASLPKPPLPAGPPPTFSFGAATSNNDNKTTATPTASSSVSGFKFGSDPTASTSSFPKVNKEEVKPALPSFTFGGASTAMPSTAFTGGKVTPPPPSASSNNMSNTPSMSMDSPNPTDHVSSISQPSLSLSSGPGPFAFGGALNSNNNSTATNPASSNPFSSSFTAPSAAPIAPFSSSVSTSTAFSSSANPFPAFGSAPSSNATSGNPFGIPPTSTLPSASSNANLFTAGSANKLATTTPSVSAFGSNNNVPTVFGSTPSSANSSASMFGAGAGQPLFGGSQPSSSSLGGGLFGSTMSSAAPHAQFGSGGPASNPSSAPFTFGGGSNSAPSAFGGPAVTPGGAFPTATPSFGGFNNSVPSNSSGFFGAAGAGGFGAGDNSQNSSSTNLVGLGGNQGGMAAGSSAFNLGKADATNQQNRRKLRVKRP